MLLGLEPHALDRVPPRPGHERYEVNSMSGLLAFRHHAFRNLHFQLYCTMLPVPAQNWRRLESICNSKFIMAQYHVLGVCHCKDPVNQGGWCI